MKNRYQRNNPGVFILVMIIIMVCSCRRQDYVPKPHAYFRIDFPEKEYQQYDDSCPFEFAYPVYGRIVNDPKLSEPCWFNIEFPGYKGTIYLTYKEINQNFDVFLEDSWTIVYKKIAQKADAVSTQEYIDPDHQVYGMIYDIKGNAASSVQFFVTDSVNHFLKGALYFAVRPNQDSLAPAVSFFRTDVMHLIESLRWKEEN